MDPTIEEWSRRYVSEQVMNGADWSDLSLIVLAVKQAGAGSPPDDVLLSWHRSLAGSRTAHRQSEIAFIESARAAGWTEKRIVAVLGLAPDSDLRAHQRSLEEQEVEQHPSQRADPWTGGRWGGTGTG